MDHFFVKSPFGPSHATLNAEFDVQREIKITSIKELNAVLKSMSRGKSPGHDGLSIEHIKFAGPHMARVLYMLYSFCVGHSYLPSKMIQTLVVPIVKNKTGDVADKNNYRAISLATVISKVLTDILGHMTTNLGSSLGYRLKQLSSLSNTLSITIRSAKH
jgi:hypothetical protein